MNKFNMDEEAWNQYFNQYPSPALEYVNNISEALKAGWLDVTTAEVRLKELSAAIREIPLDKYIKEHQQNAINFFTGK